jgi:thiol-disulfide isomerase/thioredoxin
VKSVGSLAAPALLALVACGAPPAPPQASAITDEALHPIGGGEPTTLRALAAGRPMVVDLYAIWCDGCRKQIASLEALADRIGDRAVIVGVDVGDELDAAATFASREGIGYPTFADPEFRFADSMGVSGLPHLLVVDPDGAVVHRSQKLDAETVAKLQALLGH